MIFIGIGIGKSCLNMAAATQSTIRLGQLNRSLSTTASMNGLASFVRKTLFGSEEEKRYIYNYSLFHFLMMS